MAVASQTRLHSCWWREPGFPSESGAQTYVLRRYPYPYDLFGTFLGKRVTWFTIANLWRLCFLSTSRAAGIHMTKNYNLGLDWRWNSCQETIREWEARILHPLHWLQQKIGRMGQRWPAWCKQGIHILNASRGEFLLEIDVSLLMVARTTDKIRESVG